VDDGPLLAQLLLQLVLILLNAVFACAEIAVLSVGDVKLEKLSESGNRSAKRLRRLTNQPARFLATIQVAITLAGFLGSAFAADNFAERLARVIEIPGLSAGAVETICVVLVTLILSYFTLVLGELVPKRLAMRNSEKIAMALAGLLSFISMLFAPVVWMLTVSTNGMLRLFGIDPNEEEEEVSEEEIRMMVDAGGEKGAIEPEEREMISNVFEFNDISCEEILTHRTRVTVLSLDETEEEWDEIIRGGRHSHYPVCGDTSDDVRGVLSTKDYFRLKAPERAVVMEKAVAPAYFVPETIKADVLFREMKRSRNHFAVVLDEHGGFSGVVTLNDLLEELVGDFNLDADDETAVIPDIQPLGEDQWRMKGSTPLFDVEEAADVELPRDEYDTLGGMIFGSLQEIPDDGAVCEVEVCGLKIVAESIRNHRVEMALVQKLPKPKEEDEEE